MDCQTCAKCCKRSWIFTDLEDDAIRFSWLDSKKIAVQQVKEGLWKIIFNIPCTKLIKKNGKYWCTQYNSLRPGYCKEYPHNFLTTDKDILELEKHFCPLLKNIDR